MKNLLVMLVVSFSMISFAGSSFANHCSGGHEEIKDTKDSSTEDTKETKSN